MTFWKESLLTFDFKITNEAVFMWDFCILWVGLAASTQAAKMWRENVLIIDLEPWHSCSGCFHGIRKLLWGLEGSCKAQLWLWGKWSPRGDFSAQPHPHPSCLWEAADHSVPYSLFVWLCLSTLSSVFLLASSSFSFTLVFFSDSFWCQGIYSFSLYGSHTIYIPPLTIYISSHTIYVPSRTVYIHLYTFM